MSDVTSGKQIGVEAFLKPGQKKEDDRGIGTDYRRKPQGSAGAQLPGPSPQSLFDPAVVRRPISR
jgi:hypothetical protein